MPKQYCETRELHDDTGSRDRRVQRFRKGRGFSYRFVGSGRTLTNETTRDWIKSLAIPPAWTDVEIDLNREAKIHATGYDNKARKQYVYNEEWRARREQAKFDRILGFADRLPTMRRITGQHLRTQGARRERVLACMVRLLDNAYFRAGCSTYARENRTYGLTTLRSKHLTIDGDTMIFDFIGKSGREHHKEIEDRQLTAIVKRIDELPGYEIFKYQDRDGNIVAVCNDQLNDYIQELMGEEFTAKDFRTWGGTYLAATRLNKIGVCVDTRQTDRNVLAVIDEVAEILGNTRSVARSSYIDPRVIDRYAEGLTLSSVLAKVRRRMRRRRFVTAEERALPYLLRAQA